ncbi:hypothetical protein BJY04DRAFT_116896 [Aspergillus karnatakaensis]|uniref:uncharacterized protein n=1 Tax=Aspergillus karnatakaensis TaxID=1810916 RepID=UPI003CCD04A1
MAQAQKPFVLVLVDGDGCLFHEDFLMGKQYGGKQVARILHESIAGLVRGFPENEQVKGDVVVRVYANMSRLVRTMDRVDHDEASSVSQSLSAFASSFNEAQDMFDFINSGETEDSTPRKIKATFAFFAKNSQCRHIFFAGCHNSQYIPLLKPFHGQTGRVTLLKAADFQSEYENLDLNVRELKEVFMSKPTSEGPGSPTPPAFPNICSYNLKGNCRYTVAKCKNIHWPPRQQKWDFLESIEPAWESAITAKDPVYTHRPLRQQPSSSSGSIKSASESAITHKGIVYEHWPLRQQPQSSSGSSKPPRKPAETYNSTVDVRSDEEYATWLPSYTFKAPNSIPVNGDGERVDPYCPCPRPSKFNRYDTLVKGLKLCNKHYLTGKCDNAKCRYHHGDLGFDPTTCIRFMLLQLKCKKGGQCRDIDCFYGHHCQRSGCLGDKNCNFDRHGHTLDLSAVKWASRNQHDIPEEPTKPVWTFQMSESTPETSSDDSCPLIDLD